MDYIQNLLVWYHKNKRNLPWREVSDPYKIWLSEIILQQTRVDQGLSYYYKFVNEFPELQNLANAEETKVMKLWQGLGYYSRARNLHKAAKLLVNDFSGEFPSTYEELLKIPGIGPYTAAAIASIAFNEKVPAIDGNVKRVMSRLFFIDLPIDKQPALKKIKKLSNQIIDFNEPGNYNQAMMELGAIICKPQNPLCNDCPLNSTCEALKIGIQNQLPKKERKTKIRTRYFYYYMFTYKNNTYIHQREKKDIWQGLFEFPLIETQKELDEKKILTQAMEKWEINNSIIDNISLYDTFSHVLSHQLIRATFIVIKLNTKVYFSELKVPITKLDMYPVSRLMEIFLNKEKKLP